MQAGNQGSGLSARLAPIVYLSNNWISRIGVVLVTTAGILWLFLLPTFLQGHSPDPYIGILQFLALPGVFFLGLFMIPVGMWLRRKKGEPTGLPPLTWQSPDLRKLAAFVAGATVLNLIIGSQLTYRGVEYMESVQFCGQTCHTVMKPEFTAYQNSPHSRVACVQCHIGPGAGWFVKSKLSGSWQVISVNLNLYPRPIPTPLENLRPARETCEQCHWPEKFGGNRLRVITTYDDDGAEAKTVLLMHVGGGDGTLRGIHGAHVGQGIRLRYKYADRTRQNIPWVEYSFDGQTKEFTHKDAKPDDLAKMEVRDMDCLDCHTRPSHSFDMPHRAVDRAMSSGLIPVNLPKAKKYAMEVLQKDYATTADAESQIPAQFAAYYQKEHPDVYSARKADIDKAGKAVLAVFERNVFPEMRVKWGTYPNNIGHTDFTGCFRCHDEEHKTKDGAAITQDCNTCHSLLAMDEKAPKILEELGLTPPAPEPPKEASKPARKASVPRNPAGGDAALMQ